MSPGNGTRDYDYQHQVKGTDQIWNFRDDVCRIESQKAMKCVPFAVSAYLCEMLFLTCAEHTSIITTCTAVPLIIVIIILLLLCNV